MIFEGTFDIISINKKVDLNSRQIADKFSLNIVNNDGILFGSLYIDEPLDNKTFLQVATVLAENNISLTNKTNSVYVEPNSFMRNGQWYAIIMRDHEFVEVELNVVQPEECRPKRKAFLEDVIDW